MGRPHRHFKPASFDRARITAVLLKNITQSLPQFLFWKDKNSVYLGCNQRFAELLGMDSPEEIIGKTDYDLPWQSTGGHTAEFFQQTDQAAMQGHPVDRQEECLRLPDGRQIMTLVSKLPIQDERQQVLGVVGYFSDITELKEKEQALEDAKQQAEAANRAKSLFIANMSHDLRTPLTGLLGMAQILLQEIHSPRGQEAATHLLSAGQMLLKLLNDVIEFSQWTIGQPPVKQVHFSVRKVIQEVVQLIWPAMEEKQLAFKVKYRHLPRTVRGDPFRLRQILLHLLSNAIKFTHHGQISILAQGVGRTKHDCTLSIAVNDTGIGIAPEQQSLLFSPFSRLHPAYEGRYPGVGLGLALARQLITDLNGRIECTSQPGQGSVFTCFLPLHRVYTEPYSKNSEDLKSCSLSSASANKTPSYPRWQVLCVEDNRLAQIAVKNQLTALNCDVECVENGVQALACAAQKTYHIIFLDMGLPDMDGCEVARRIRADRTNPNFQTPIIALTAHVGADNQQHCLAAGIQQVISKPLNDEQACKVIQIYAGKKL